MYALLLFLNLFENRAIGLCTCSADLSFCSKLGGVGQEEVNACVRLDGADT